MAKFINKKEQVFDLKLTPYAKNLMARGKFKPAFYAFYDDNVLYDTKYAHSSANESQNNVDPRIKQDTQYLETLYLFEDLERKTKRNLDESDTLPNADIFKIESSIGDAFLDGPTQNAPAWRTLALQSFISSSSTYDTTNDTKIPQVNVSSFYKLQISEFDIISSFENVRNSIVKTDVFADENIIEIGNKDPLFYVEELNTELLTKNFDLEVFEILSSSIAKFPEQLERKYFRTQISNVQNGFLISEKPDTLAPATSTTSSVEYYFDVFVDSNVDRRLACIGADKFDKTPYYIDLGFDCNFDQEENVFYDIYGAAIGEPEICEQPETDECLD